MEKPVQPSVNSSYLPNIYDEQTEDEEGEDHSPSASLLPKHTSTPLAVRYSPVDSYRLVYFIFFLMGISSLLPWNFFITARDYWSYKLSNSSDPSGQHRSDVSVSWKVTEGLLDSTFKPAERKCAVKYNVFSSFLFFTSSLCVTKCALLVKLIRVVFVFSAQDNFESYLSVASTVPSVLCLILNYFLVNRLISHSHFWTHIMFCELVVHCPDV